MKKILLCSVLILCSMFVFSQEKGDFGFLFKSSSISNIGVTYNLSNHLSLRPSFGFSSSNTDQNDTTSILYYNPDLNSYNANLGLFYYFLKKDQLSAYSGFELSYFNEKTYRFIYSGSYYEKSDVENSGTSGSLILGFQYNLNKHFAIFGEVALSYLHSKTDDELSQIPYKFNTDTWNLSRSGFGIIFYL